MKKLALVVLIAALGACSQPASPPAAEAPPAAPAAAEPVDTREIMAKPAYALKDVKIDAPAANARLTSPIKVTGAAPGSWYFEAVFPIKLVDEAGAVLAEAPAQAMDDWMTVKPVHFASELKFKVTQETKAWLVLARDNESGETEHDAEIRIPVTLLPNR